MLSRLLLFRFRKNFQQNNIQILTYFKFSNKIVKNIAASVLKKLANPTRKLRLPISNYKWRILKYAVSLEKSASCVR